jgi:hypothetical protein
MVAAMEQRFMMKGLVLSGWMQESWAATIRLSYHYRQMCIRV